MSKLFVWKVDIPQVSNRIPYGYDTEIVVAETEEEAKKEALDFWESEGGDEFDKPEKVYVECLGEA